MSESNKAVFLSYASQDAEAANRICEALRTAGIEVWFDQNELVGGDQWDAKIRGQIKSCALFMPVISANTEARREGYFRIEWKLAAQRTHAIADGIPFLLPIVIDATRDREALVPTEFQEVQWTRLPGGVATPQFVGQVKGLLEPERKYVEKSGDLPSLSPSITASKSPSKLPLLSMVVAAVIAVGAILFFVLKHGPKEKSAVIPTVAKVSNKSIAILPLANMSEDKDTGFFADGVHEDLLTNLALISELKVVSRTSVMQYRGTTKTIKQIGEELGVAYVLEGSVRRAGNKVRVTGQLINTRTDEHVWAKSYDRDLTDIFAIQADLSKEIASALETVISPQAKKFIERRPTENPVAYDFFLKGRNSRNVGRSGFLKDLHKQCGWQPRRRMSSNHSDRMPIMVTAIILGRPRNTRSLPSSGPMTRPYFLRLDLFFAARENGPNRCPIQPKRSNWIHAMRAMWPPCFRP